MGGSSGGGGSGQSTTTSQASYAPEFKPLAKSAVEQIQAMQKLLPLISFTGYQPQPTAGLAPMQRFAIENLVPGTFAPTPGLQASQDTTLPLGLLGYGAIGAGGPTGAGGGASWGAPCRERPAPRSRSSGRRGASRRSTSRGVPCRPSGSRPR